MQNQSPIGVQLHMEVAAMEQLADVLACLQQYLGQWLVPEEKQLDLKLCVMEAVQNALLHGSTRAKVVWQCDGSAFCFTVEDDGPGIPREIQNGVYQETLKESGRGLLLMRAILDELQFNEKGNAITGILRW